MTEPNHEYEAKKGDLVTLKSEYAIVIEVDEDIYDAKIELLDQEKQVWVKQSELELIRR